MRYLIIISLLCGCVTNEDYKTIIRMNIENGRYNSLASSTWDKKEYVCAMLSLIKPHFGVKWKPQVSLIFKDEENMFTATIKLQPEKNSPKSNALTFGLHEKNKDLWNDNF